MRFFSWLFDGEAGDTVRFGKNYGHVANAWRATAMLPPTLIAAPDTAKRARGHPFEAAAIAQQPAAAPEAAP